MAVIVNETPDDNSDLVTPDPVVEVNTPSLLDSITAALEPTLPKTPAATEGEDDELETEGSEETEDDEDETDENGAPRERDPATGKFLPKTVAPAKAGEGAGKDAAKPAVGADGKPLVDDKAAKKVDPVNDPIPEDVKGRTRERMTALIATVKEKDEYITVQNQLFDSIQSTGASPEEFGAMLGYMRWIHSDKPEDLKQARTLLLSELEGLSLKLGEAAPGVDFLSKFPDLQEKVNNGQITVDDANEMALHRQRTKVNTDRDTATRTQAETAQATKKEVDDTIAELDALGKTLAATDPLFAQKHAALKPLLATLGMMPPKQWKAAFMQAYKAVKVTAPVAGGGAPAGGKPNLPGGQPLRGNKVPSGGQARQPTSLLDAVSNAVDQAG